MLNLEMVLIGCLQITSNTNIQVNEHIATEPSLRCPFQRKERHLYGEEQTVALRREQTLQS